jgi:sugar/nucleoside kinase (ribokinase family)
MLDVITIGGATRDIFFETTELERLQDKKSKNSYFTIPYGHKIISKKTTYSYGGGAVNVAVSLSRLGLKVATNCNIGKEGSGSILVKYLKHEGVGTQYISRDEKNHTGMSFLVLGKDGEHTGFLERGANNNYKFKGFGTLKKARWFYLTSLTGEAANYLPKIFKYAKKKGIKVAFNPGSVQLEKGLSHLSPFLADTEVLFLNMDEARELLKRKKVNLSKVENILRALAECGPTMVVVTAGADGSWVIFEDNIYFEPALPQKVVDTTGAGDSFGSTFLFGVISGFALPHTLRVASINAASVIGQMGAGPGLLTYNKIKSSKWL